MAEVHLFGGYLNLHGHSIAARGEQGKGGRYEESGGEQMRTKRVEDMKKEKSRGEEHTITSWVRRERTHGWSEVHLGKSYMM